MDNNRLLDMEWLEASDREACKQSLPAVLESLFTWISRDAADAAPEFTDSIDIAATKPGKELPFGRRDIEIGVSIVMGPWARKSIFKIILRAEIKVWEKTLE
jgi:hypothetical protein